MPLKEYFGGKGEEVKKKMRRKYGKKKGDRVFYATANKRNLGPSDDFKKKNKLND